MTLTLALPKGRIAEELLPMLKMADIEPEADFFDKNSRKLAFATNQEDVQLIRVRAFDVATFVAFGGAGIGVAGSDVLDEFDYPDMYAPLDLGIGKCRLSLAAPKGTDLTELKQASHIRVATKYPNCTQRYFAAKGIQSECIKLSGAMELAPTLGLAKYIVDLVSTGGTLKANGLEELEVISEISSRLIVSRAAYKTNTERYNFIINAFREVVASA